MTQLVPSDCNIANLPAVAAKIAVPVEAEPRGTTLVEALTTEFAEIFLTYNTRPEQVLAVGRVNVLFAVEKIRDESVDATV